MRSITILGSTGSVGRSTVALLEESPPDAFRVEALVAHRDVTGLAVFLTNNETSAAVSKDGLVKAGQRGEAFVMARFETFTVGSQVLVLPKGLEFEYPSEPEDNYIDGLVAAKLKKLRIAPSEICSDEEFLRRAYVDVVGLVPVIETDSYALMKQLVARGRGFTLLPLGCIRAEVAAGQHTSYPVSPTLTRDVAIAFASPRPPPLAVTTVAAVCRETIAALVAEGRWPGRLLHAFGPEA